MAADPLAFGNEVKMLIHLVPGLTLGKFGANAGFGIKQINRKLNGTAKLYERDVMAIIRELARCEAIEARSQARHLLGQMDILDMPADLWNVDPFKDLTNDDPAEAGRPKEQLTADEKRIEDAHIEAAQSKDLSGDDPVEPDEHPTPEIHTIPFPQNPFFTGRKKLLEQLGRQLHEHGSVAINQPVSISGLGGIGKTQLALEYAHRSYRTVYRAVFWVEAADGPTLQAGYHKLAQRLELPEHNECDAERWVQAVKRWLEKHTNWLLILDNADDLYVARNFLPAKPRGHILVTTRSRIVSALSAKAMHIEIERMEPAEGLLFLLRRVGLADIAGLAANVRKAAKELVTLLGGHPLALDQAGAYIEEACVPIARYIQLYQKARQRLLQRRGFAAHDESDHPDSVAATVTLSFEAACKRCPQAADVLYFCSFLLPNAIPEEVLLHAEGLKLDILSLNEVVAVLQRYSLIKRNMQNMTFSMHHLVHAVLYYSMSPGLRKQWFLCVVRTLCNVFPNGHSKRLSLHVANCANRLASDESVSVVDARLLFSGADRIGLEMDMNIGESIEIARQRFFSMAEKYSDREIVCQRFFSMAEKYLGVEHPYTVKFQIHLAGLCMAQGKYEQAETLYEQALTAIGHQVETAVSLTKPIEPSLHQGERERVEGLYQHVLGIVKQGLVTKHPYIEAIRRDYAAFLSSIGRGADAFAVGWSST